MQQPEHDLRAFQTSYTSPRRYISLGLVAALHVVLIWALATGLATQFIKKLPDEFKAQVVKQKPPSQPKTPPPPPPQLAKPPPPFVPPPEINIQTTTTNTTAISNVQSRHVAPPAPAKIEPPRPSGRRHDCYSGYPPISKRLGEEGKVLVEFTVSADGSVTNAKVAKSSGYSRLDRAAVQCVSDFHYHPATQGGKPIAIRTKVQVAYELR